MHSRSVCWIAPNGIGCRPIASGGKAISMGWHPESGFIERNWDGYNEGMALYFLALGSRSHLAKEGAFEAWTAPFPKYWRGEGVNRYLSFAPHFAHQYGAVWVDYRGIYDATTLAAGFDYFEVEFPPRHLCAAQLCHCQPHGLGWIIPRTSGASAPAMDQVI